MIRRLVVPTLVVVVSAAHAGDAPTPPAPPPTTTAPTTTQVSVVKTPPPETTDPDLAKALANYDSCRLPPPGDWQDPCWDTLKEILRRKGIRPQITSFPATAIVGQKIVIRGSSFRIGRRPVRFVFETQEYAREPRTAEVITTPISDDTIEVTPPAFVRAGAPSRVRLFTLAGEAHPVSTSFFITFQRPRFTPAPVLTSVPARMEIGCQYKLALQNWVPNDMLWGHTTDLSMSLWGDGKLHVRSPASAPAGARSDALTIVRVINGVPHQSTINFNTTFSPKPDERTVSNQSPLVKPGEKFIIQLSGPWTPYCVGSVYDYYAHVAMTATFKGEATSGSARVANAPPAEDRYQTSPYCGWGPSHAQLHCRMPSGHPTPTRWEWVDISLYDVRDAGMDDKRLMGTVRVKIQHYW